MSTPPPPYAESSRHHQAAMDLADRGDLAHRDGDPGAARAFYRDACDAEVRAIRALPAPEEPTWSVLHRSAASLAFQCGEWREAERLIASALAGTPPEEIAEELRDLLGRTWRARELGARRSA